MSVRPDIAELAQDYLREQRALLAAEADFNEFRQHLGPAERELRERVLRQNPEQLLKLVHDAEQRREHDVFEAMAYSLEGGSGERRLLRLARLLRLPIGERSASRLSLRRHRLSSAQQKIEVDEERLSNYRSQLDRLLAEREETVAELAALGADPDDEVGDAYRARIAVIRLHQEAARLISDVAVHWLCEHHLPDLVEVVGPLPERALGQKLAYADLSWAAALWIAADRVVPDEFTAVVDPVATEAHDRFEAHLAAWNAWLSVHRDEFGESLPEGGSSRR